MAQAPTILIVDDDEDFRRLTRLFLEKDGYHVNEAADGDVALLVACSALTPDLILLDAEMPGMDGFDACRRFRIHPVTAKTPILMVTAFTDEGSVDKAFACGAEDFINKPIHWPVLRQRIHHILERKQAVQILADNEARYRRVYEGISLSYHALDEKGAIVEVNRRWLSLFGYEFKDVEGQRFSDFLSPDSQKTFQKIMLDIDNANGVVGECEIVCKSGDLRMVAIYARVEGEQIGSSRRSHYLLNDITEQTEIFNNLQNAEQEAVSANREKSTILATVSHDLRAPMNAILGMGELLAEGVLGQKEREYLQIMTRAGENLLTLIDDILDISKMDAGFSLIEKVAFKPRELVLGILEMFHVQAEKKGITLKRQIVDDSPDLVFGDPRRLRQVFINLLGNALKFTESGGIITFTMTAEGMDRFRFSVKDSGIGISHERQELIFHPFIQAEADTAKKYGGSGLGLSICQKLIHNMGGDLKINSSIGMGSEFFFTIPMSRVETTGEQTVERATRNERRLESDSAIEPMLLNILVVDDSPDNRLLVGLFLKEITKTIQSVENGLLGVEAFKNGQFDIILMDMEMPVMGGLEATRQIRALELEQGRVAIPIVAFSADNSPSEARASIEAGCTIKLDKPVKKKRMVDVITQCVRGQV
jgi:PAS domain S-box-containing protein